MSTLTVIDNKFVTLMYHTESKIVHHVFHQKVEGEEFRNVLNEGLEIFKKYGAHKWLSDDRKNSALSEEDTTWAKTEWFPKVLEAGWQHWAIVWPDNVMAMLNMKEFIDTYRTFGLRVMVFNKDKPALDWLERMGERKETTATPS
ncbi:MAG: hypothetical protein R3E39_19600 [Anaerolineae bacterium]